MVTADALPAKRNKPPASASREERAVRLARKQVGWYLGDLPESREFRSVFNALESGKTQVNAIIEFLDQMVCQQNLIDDKAVA